MTGAKTALESKNFIAKNAEKSKTRTQRKAFDLLSFSVLSFFLLLPFASFASKVFQLFLTTRRFAIHPLPLFVLASFVPAAHAQRIVTLAPHLAELVCALDRCDALVGVSAWTDYPAQAQAKPTIGDAFNVDYERVLALRPDLVLAWRGGTRDDSARKLESLGLQIAWIDSAGLEDIGDAILDVGGWIGAEDEACALEAAYRERLAALRQRYARPDGVPPQRVFYQVQLDPLFTVSAASPISEAIALCGGDNVFSDLPQIAAAVGLESVIARRPQLIVHGDDVDTGLVRQFWGRFSSLPAVAHQHYVAARVDLLARQSPRILDGVESLCEDMRRWR